MYIDTHSNAALENFICEYFSVSPDDLSDFIKEFDKAVRVNGWIEYTDESDEILDGFINSMYPYTQIDQILFFHLSRRLNSANQCNETKNLYDLLTTENPMTDFFREHDVKFTHQDKRIDIIDRGQLVRLDDRFQEYVPYLRGRLGHDQDHVDFCPNGFLFKEKLYDNHYASSLYDGPEFASEIAEFLKRYDIEQDYVEKSTYYCFEYCLPIERIIIDGKDNLCEAEKKRYLLRESIIRLHEKDTTSRNIILRLEDDDMLEARYYITREEISSDML